MRLKEIYRHPILWIICILFTLASLYLTAFVDEDSTVQINSQPVSQDFPWYRGPQEMHPAIAPQTTSASNAATKQVEVWPDADGVMMPGQQRQQALGNMRRAQFFDAWGYLRAREFCLSGAVFSPELGCSDLAAIAKNDAETLRLLQGGAERSIPEAEMALAQWWVSEFVRKMQSVDAGQAASPELQIAPPTIDLERQAEAQQAKRKAIEVLTLAAPHNTAAATRLLELQAAWANLE